MIDFPDTAKFLSPEERAFIIWRKSKLISALNGRNDSYVSSEYDNSSVGEEERFAVRHIWAAFTDWKVRY
jgi:hypothetical protein